MVSENLLFNPSNSADGEDEYVGCPREIFALTSLRRLNLGFHGLRQLPSHIQQLTMLEELIISNSPLLESLPGELALLPHLRGLFSKSWFLVWDSALPRNDIKHWLQIAAVLSSSNIQLCTDVFMIFVMNILTYFHHILIFICWRFL